ncbi:hypothetical protein C8J56DRAFT_1161390 [Mycena floridula]|nr:hypothetical protein C8J56DRAFT_1161390 [Mycena floridula]
MRPLSTRDSALVAVSNKQPFQDITERVLAELTPQPKRRVKRPRPPSSSLPPSSPEPARSSSSRHYRRPTITSDVFQNDDLASDDQTSPSWNANAPIDFADRSDPFGFLAVEKKLKEERIHNPEPLPVIVRRPVPRTPSKSVVVKRLIPEIPSDPSSPSSPSPIKPRPGKAARKEESIKQESDEEEDLPPRGKRKKATSREPLARSLALLPKKPIRKSTRRAKEVIDEGRPGKARKRVQKVEESEDIDVDFDQKAHRERQVRLDYFKKLEGYSMAKENVYIV